MGIIPARPLLALPPPFPATPRPLPSPNHYSPQPLATALALFVSSILPGDAPQAYLQKCLGKPCINAGHPLPRRASHPLLPSPLSSVKKILRQEIHRQRHITREGRGKHVSRKGMEQHDHRHVHPLRHMCTPFHHHQPPASNAMGSRIDAWFSGAPPRGMLAPAHRPAMGGARPAFYLGSLSPASPHSQPPLPRPSTPPSTPGCQARRPG